MKRGGGKNCAEPRGGGGVRNSCELVFLWRFLAILKGGIISFTIRGGGGCKFIPCLERGHKKFQTPVFPIS